MGRSLALMFGLVGAALVCIALSAELATTRPVPPRRRLRTVTMEPVEQTRLQAAVAEIKHRLDADHVRDR